MASDEEEQSDDVSETESEWNSQGEDEEDEEDTLRRSRSILWLCQEGQVHLARQRIDMLVECGKSDDKASEKLRKEIFQVGRDKNYPLHEILMGGTSDANAYAATVAILDVSNGYPMEQRTMLSAMPPSHLRTPLHWAAWGNAKMEILVALVNGNPEALLVRDKKSQGQRTPLEILKRYFGNSSVLTEQDHGKIPFLERATANWISRRVGLAVHLVANRYFGTKKQQEPRLVPFDQCHRKESSIKPKSWFFLSVIGYLIQREMKPLALKILSYLGGHHNAKKRPVAVSKRGRRKRARLVELEMG